MNLITYVLSFLILYFKVLRKLAIKMTDASLVVAHDHDDTSSSLPVMETNLTWGLIYLN